MYHGADDDPADSGQTIRLSKPASKKTFHFPIRLPKINSHVVAFGSGIIAILLIIFAIQYLRPPANETLAKQANFSASAMGYATEVPAKPNPQVPLQKFVAPPPTLLLPNSSEPPKPAADATPTVAAETGTLQLTTIPAGAKFAIYSGVVEGPTAPATEPVRIGTAPESISDMPPGRYTIFLHNDGWPDDRTEVSIAAGETVPVSYNFPHGTVTITSTPEGAEIFADRRSLGRTPLMVHLPPGKQQLTGRHSGFPDRTQTVMIENDKATDVAFKFRARSRSPSKPKATPTPSALDRLGNTLRKVFGPKRPPPPPKNSRKKH